MDQALRLSVAGHCGGVPLHVLKHQYCCYSFCIQSVGSTDSRHAEAEVCRLWRLLASRKSEHGGAFRHEDQEISTLLKCLAPSIKKPQYERVVGSKQ